MFNPFSWLWNLVSTMFYFLFNPKELAKALADSKVQAVYHLSSINTAVGTFVTSLAYPEWARSAAATAAVAWAALYEWATVGPGGIAAKEAYALVVELVFGGPAA